MARVRTDSSVTHTLTQFRNRLAIGFAVFTAACGAARPSGPAHVRVDGASILLEGTETKSLQELHDGLVKFADPTSTDPAARIPITLDIAAGASSASVRSVFVAAQGAGARYVDFTLDGRRFAGELGTLRQSDALKPIRTRLQLAVDPDHINVRWQSERDCAEVPADQVLQRSTELQELEAAVRSFCANRPVPCFDHLQVNVAESGGAFLDVLRAMTVVAELRGGGRVWLELGIEGTRESLRAQDGTRIVGGNATDALRGLSRWHRVCGQSVKPLAVSRTAAILEQAEKDARKCYERWPGKNNDAIAWIAIRLQADNDGTISASETSLLPSVAPLYSRMEHPPATRRIEDHSVIECVLDVYRSQRFPPFGGATYLAERYAAFEPKK